MDPRREYLGNYRYANSCQKLNTSTKAVYVTKLLDALILQLNIFKYIHDISKKVIEEEISFWGKGMVLSVIIYHEGEQSHCRHYISGIG